MKWFLLTLLLSALVIAQPVVLTPSHAEQEVCLWDTAVFALNSSGPDGEYFYSIEGDAKWGTMVPHSASLKKFENVFAYFTPGCFEKTGTYNFQAIAASTFGRAVSILTLHVVPCISVFNGDGKSQVTGEKVCLGDKITKKIVLKNKTRTTGNKYVIELRGDTAGITVAKEVVVPAGGEASFDIVFDSKAAGQGKHSFEILFTGIHPETGEPTEDKASATIEFDVQSCASAQLVFNSSGQRCTDSESRFPLAVKNTGRDASFTAKVENMSFSRLSETRFFLKNNETKNIELIVDLGVKPSQYRPRIIVSSEFDSFELAPELEYKKCWDVALNGLGGEVCQCEDKSFTFDVINTGSFDDAYDVFIKQKPDWFKPEFFNDTVVELKSGQKKTMAAATFDCNATLGVHTVMFAAISQTKKSSDDLGIELNVRPKSVCYIAGFETETIRVNAGEEKRFSVKVKNTGIIDNVYSLSSDGPPELKLEQNTLQLKHGEERDVFLSIKVPSESVGREANVRIKAVSKDVVSFKDFKIISVAPGGEIADETKQIQADVSFDAGVFVVTTENGATVAFVSPLGAVQEVATENGVAKFKANQTGEWTIRVSKAGFETLEMTFDAGRISALSGFFTASSRGALIAIILLIALFVVTFAYLSLGKAEKKEKKK
ncbi:MAG: hypothetical protein V1811_03460 [Candidatus Micrarchaeota archaeon]